eukprot:scaffold16499_cov121-Isochrysis_galbana.AAC.8
MAGMGHVHGMGCVRALHQHSAASGHPLFLRSLSARHCIWGEYIWERMRPNWQERRGRQQNRKETMTSATLTP